mmetsp:Transcript_39246/g.125079  ORF Transcript_39246/g.125079 Transcript_39246/m.125079 type:complete len:123 (-) Transcript_39246:132-500(-)
MKDFINLSDGPRSRCATLDNALGAMRVYNEDSQPRTAQDMPRARAKMRLADQVAASEGQKDALLRILMFVVLSDAIGTFIMTPVTPRIYTPPPDSAKVGCSSLPLAVVDVSREGPQGTSLVS